MNIYLENIIDLYKHPLNHGELKDASVTHHAYSPLCGDDITVDLKIEEGKIADVRHRGVGCAISQASISLLTDEIKNKTLDEVMKMKPDQVVEMLGIELGPVRLKCALLGLEAIHQAIGKWKEER
ncbi:MAG: iron-sulfur cluster assembly scaffold protein [Candidatus Altimarinota bacterium]